MCLLRSGFNFTTNVWGVTVPRPMNKPQLPKLQRQKHFLQKKKKQLVAKTNGVVAVLMLYVAMKS